MDANLTKEVEAIHAVLALLLASASVSTLHHSAQRLERVAQLKKNLAEDASKAFP